MTLSVTKPLYNEQKACKIFVRYSQATLYKEGKYLPYFGISSSIQPFDIHVTISELGCHANIFRVRPFEILERLRSTCHRSLTPLNTTWTGRTAEMKSIIRKIRGKMKNIPTPNQTRNDFQQPTPSGLNTSRLLLATEHVKFSPRLLCRVCGNFDPKFSQDGESHQTGWAKIEYNIPDETPATERMVEKSEILLEAAGNGCPYCVMVKLALGALHPGWETDSTFIHIFLAAGLPVVVRLQFGYTTIAVEGGEEYTVTVLDDSKPPIEIEIYQPVILDNQRLTRDGMSFSSSRNKVNI